MGDEPRLLKPGEPQWWQRPATILIGVVVLVVVIIWAIYQVVEP